MSEAEETSVTQEQKNDDASKCKILDIYWERIFLHLIVENASGKDLYLRSKDKPLVLLRQEPISKVDLERLKNYYPESTGIISNSEKLRSIELNIAAANERSFLDNAKWEIGYYDAEEPPEGNFAYKYSIDTRDGQVLFQEEKIKRRQKKLQKVGREDQLVKKDQLIFCTLDSSLVPRLDGLDKVFRYDGVKYAYTVNFTVYSFDGISLNLNINSFFMRENAKWEKRLLVFGSKKPKDIWKRYIFALKTTVFQVFYTIRYKLSPHDGRNILLLTETSPAIGGNLECLYQRMLERGLDKEYNITISAREQIGNNHSYFSWFSVLRKISKADYIFIDNYVPIFSRLKLNPKVKLIQLWHAGVGFKSVGFARFGKKASPYASGSGHQQYSWALAPSKALVKTYEEVFGIDKKFFLPTGMLRLDGFLEQNKVNAFKQEFYERYPELVDKKLILFTPTYRGSGQKDAYYEYGMLDMERIFDYCGDESVFIFKMHPFTKDTLEYYEEKFPTMETEIRDMRLRPDLSKYYPRIMDLTGKEDTNSLFYVADILITDYSSVLYEFSAMQKPMLFYTPDRVMYEATRGVHQSIKRTAPGKVCDTFDELMDSLEKQDYDYEKTVQFAQANFDHELSGATDRLIDSVLLVDQKG